MPKPDFSHSRMVFTEEELKTDILRKTKEESRSAAHKSIDEYLDDFCLKNPDRDVVEFTNVDIYNKWFERSKWDLSYISKVLKYELKLEKSEKVIRYRTLENIHPTVDGRGRPYSIKNPYFGMSIDDSNLEIKEEDDDGLPF